MKTTVIGTFCSNTHTQMKKSNDIRYKIERRKRIFRTMAFSTTRSTFCIFSFKTQHFKRTPTKTSVYVTCRWPSHCSILSCNSQSSPQLHLSCYIEHSPCCYKIHSFKATIPNGDYVKRTASFLLLCSGGDTATSS
ncbi:hypothetical protein Tcan_00923, partial [Toxocara canis]